VIDPAESERSGLQLTHLGGTLTLNMAVITYSALDIVSYALFGALRG